MATRTRTSAWLDWNRRPIETGDRVKIQGDTTAYDAVPTYVINSFGTVAGFARTKVIVHVDGHGDRPFRVPPKGLQVIDTERPARELERHSGTACDHEHEDVTLHVPAEIHGPAQQWFTLHKEIGESEVHDSDGRPIGVKIHDLFDGTHMIDLHDGGERLATVRIPLRPLWTEGVMAALVACGRAPAPESDGPTARPWTDTDEALQAVRELHRARRSDRFPNGRCASCYTVTGGSVSWPCRTLRAMGVTG